MSTGLRFLLVGRRGSGTDVDVSRDDVDVLGCRGRVNAAEARRWPEARPTPDPVGGRVIAAAVRGSNGQVVGCAGAEGAEERW